METSQLQTMKRNIEDAINRLQPARRLFIARNSDPDGLEEAMQEAHDALYRAKHVVEELYGRKAMREYLESWK